MIIRNITKTTLIADRVVMANSFFSRLIGLLNRSELLSGEALILTNSNCIHMFFMRFAIDVIFLDKDNRVVGLAENLKPFRVSSICSKASRAIEMPTGTIQSSKTVLGDVLEIR